ncbi:uncharacterized protein METZ01_LOCUS164183, partial [marine metagenome]
RPMRLAFTNLWAFSGPFQTLPMNADKDTTVALVFG